MTALVVLNIKRSLDKNHAISERDARILLAHLDAQEKRIAELEDYINKHNAEVIKRYDEEVTK